MHEALGNDERDMICAETAAGVETRRKAFLRKWRLECRAVADSLEETGDRLCTFTRREPPQCSAVRTTNAIERPNAVFRRRINSTGKFPSRPSPFIAALRHDRLDAPRIMRSSQSCV